MIYNNLLEAFWRQHATVRVWGVCGDSAVRALRWHGLACLWA